MADVGADRGPGNSAADRGEVVAAPVADLMTENAADYGAGNRAGNVSFAFLLWHLFLLDPAALFGGPTTARTEVTFAWYRRSLSRRR